MTEAKWLRCLDPKRMLLFVQGKVSTRRLRLCWCGCCRANLREPNAEIIERAVRIGEQDADDLPVSAAEITEASEALQQTLDTTQMGGGRTRLIEAMFCLSDDPLRMYRLTFSQTNRLLHLTLRFAFWIDGGWWPAARRSQARIWCAVIRCAVGNPFRLGIFSPEWRTDTALSLARQMYESRDFGAMPILADALQDAGCDNEDILNHCRDANQVHVRGCWVVDLVLGKE